MVLDDEVRYKSIISFHIFSLRLNCFKLIINYHWECSIYTRFVLQFTKTELTWGSYYFMSAYKLNYL